MLLAWMAYSVLFGALVYAAGLAVDRVAATWNRAQRFVWVVAILGVTTLPLLFAIRPARRVDPLAGSSTAASLDVDIHVGALHRSQEKTVRPDLSTRIAPVVSAAEPYISRAWLVTSLACFTLLLRAMVAVRRQRRRWRPVDLNGTRVLVAEQTGPAVVGVLAPAVVIPQWALGLDAPARSLMLRHEAEHIRARDPLLLFAAAVATALFPWNAPLWLLVRRLRLAIEIDCDRRVLRASPAQHEYGLLLLTVGARRAEPLPFAASLAERRPFLERRIKAMTSTSPKYPRLVSLACVALAIVATTAAVRAPRPQSLLAATVPAPATPALAVVTPDVSPIGTPDVPPVRVTQSIAANVSMPSAPTAAILPTQARLNPDSLTVAEIRALIASHHPTVLNGDPDINTITLIVDARGNYVVSAAENRPWVTMNDAADEKMARARGRIGGADVVVDGANGVARGGGRVGRGGGVSADAPGPPDSAMKVQLAMAKANIQNLLAKLQGDTIFFAMRTQVPRPDGGCCVVKMEDGRGFLGGQKRVGDVVGLNMPMLDQLIDMNGMESVHVRTFTAGQISATPLRVYVVRMRP